MKIVLNYEQIAEAIRNYVEDKKLCPEGTTSVVVELEATRVGWFSPTVTFEANVTCKNGKENG